MSRIKKTTERCDAFLRRASRDAYRSMEHVKEAIEIVNAEMDYVSELMFKAEDADEPTEILDEVYDELQDYHQELSDILDIIENAWQEIEEKL